VPNFWRIKLGEELTCKTGVYLKRWYIETPLFSLRLHHWLSGDDDRHYHDHPWNFVTVVLKGSYVDVAPWPFMPYSYHDTLTQGTIRYRPADHKHYVEVADGGCWTLLITGSRYRRWGFWIMNKFMKANKYFLSFGSHQCH
jgi:hypothetical protein